MQLFLSILAGIVLFLLVEKAVRYVDDMCGETNAQSHGHHRHHRKSNKKLMDDTDAIDDLQVSSVIKKGGSISNMFVEGTNEEKITDDYSNGELQNGTVVLRKVPFHAHQLPKIAYAKKILIASSLATGENVSS
ncbi:hypothetical protein AgCh_004736 [Apium graveolens]